MAPRVDVHLPSYRPRSLVPLLAWLATHLAQPNAEISWYLDKRQGPNAVKRLLEGIGWNLETERQGRLMRLRGTAPHAQSLPEPASFIAQLGAHEARLRADYGVFSPHQVDEGTALLLEVALNYRADVVADIGTGYGPLAIGLVLNSVAKSAVGTEVDCLAMWLARQNAADLNVPLELVCDPDPLRVPMTPLTVCNVPTHVNASESAQLMAGLVKRAEFGKVFAVIHASIARRYARHFESAGLGVIDHPGKNHVVLEACT
ncbi:methyltransferase [Actinopolymorpha sp. B17G11]|uniref:methyltransferase n=1 Tax=Actinopolymorpha sp. B17G11 TaxID=3160861 RepID=UPI0032E515C6